MKKTILAIILFATTATVSAQFYISAGSGYSFGTGKKVLGIERILSPSGNTIKTLKGSYGEGVHTQLKGGYFFNKKFGVELGVGYLHGTNQDVQKISGSEIAGVPGITANIKARGRAFGASLAGIYNITKGLYVRAGLLTKLGGKTEVIGTVRSKLPARLVNPNAPATMLVDLDLDFTTDFQGKFPLGFSGAVGYKFPIDDNLSLYAEIDYMNINVTRDTSKLREFSANIGGQKITRDQLKGALANLPAENRATFSKMLPLLEDESKWGEGDLPSSKAPYSSIGFSFGVTYSFN
ncbi:MAG: outer membrane beta-barrel protein [Tenacibaculum sp.]|nr:outer membrane beta-barrel protein [Tenacibaculum sp.]